MGKRRQPIDEETDGCIKRMMNQKSTIKHRDDDFDVLPRQSMINEIQFPKMTCRCCPKVLVNSMKDITEIQKNAIREIGFGHVLSLSVTEVPSKLCYWLLENFEPKSCEISLQNGRRIRIQPDDVQRVFGFPKGKRIIEKKKKNHKCELTAIWRRMFHENDGNVVLSTLSKKLLSDTEGGEWFKRHFMILLTTCLIESNSTGSISPQIMHCFEEVNQISDWDWGDFVIKCLIDHTISWKKNKNNAFVGPSLFITALYVDRVVVYNRIVPRSFLTIVNWDSSLLRQRQATEIKSGGFGGGFPDDPINMDIYMSDASVKHTLHEVVTSLKNDVASSEKQSRSFDLTKYAEKFLMLAESLAETMVELMSLIENAPTPMKDNIQYKQMIEVTRNLVGCNIMTYPSVESPSNLGPLMTQPGDKFWSIAEKMTRIMEIESAMEKRDEFLRKQDDIPSFSLGLTQEIMGGVDDVASGANKDGNHGIDSDFSKQAKENLVVEINNHEEMLDATNDTHQEDSFHARLPHQEV